MKKNISAIRPNFIKPEEKATKVVKTEDPNEEEEFLLSGSKTPFWRVLKEIMENELVELDSKNRQAIATGLSFDEIGKNTVVINMAKDIIEKIIHKVEDIKELNG